MSALTPADCLALLGGVGLGRVVFHRNALPVIRPVNHLLDEGQIVVRMHAGGAIAALAAASHGAGAVVAYQADDIDPISHLGWSVVAVGHARLLVDEERRRRVSAVLRPWVDGQMEQMLCIEPEDVTGFRLT